MVRGEETQPFGCVTFKNKMRHPSSVVIRAKNWVTADSYVSKYSTPKQSKDAQSELVAHWLIEVT